MSLLYRIIYAAHAKGTHHKLALDALAHLSGPDADGWRRLFLKHAETYMVGAKTPDDVFKDFKNHVLHPRDGYWGGAPATSRQWYERTISHLRSSDWEQAVYAAGILSHYVTDAVHPFHTGQSEAENSIHRAFEWSTAKSYDDLKAAANGGAVGAIAVPDRADWLEEMLRIGAARSNAHYEKLIAHYDINKGVVDPPAGLDVVAQRILGDIILYATRLSGVILGRALAEARVAPPEVSLTLDTVMAAIKIPIKQLAKRMQDKADRLEVERIYDELRATGTVERNLSEDDKVVREAHRAEVRRASSGPVLDAPVAPLHTLPAFVTLAERLSMAGPPPSAPSQPSAHVHTAAILPIGPAAPGSRATAATPLPTPSAAKPAPAPAAHSVPSVPIKPATIAKAQAPSATAAKPVEQPARPTAPAAAAKPAVLTPIDAGAQRRAGPRLRLAPGDDIVDAPSIGPRMAERLRPLGVLTVRDLLDEEPVALAKALAMPQVTADTIRDWQAQAILVCTVPGLTGTGAQLFVGAGMRDVAAIAAAEPSRVCADLLAFAGSDKGRRILRDGEPPDVERIKDWAEAARIAKAA